MKANELRIGNWVKSNVSANVLRFTTYQFNDLNEILSCSPPKPKLEPILLTEEWLVKFGFEKYQMNMSKNIDLFGGGKQLSFSGDYLYLIDSENPNTTPTDIILLWNKDVMKKFYVHQLQNLYFALTGEELEIK